MAVGARGGIQALSSIEKLVVTGSRHLSDFFVQSQ
jgi:hypothetical protein